MVERLRARDRDGERALLVDGFDLLDERLRLVVVDERDPGRSLRGDPPRRARRPDRRGRCSRGRERAISPSSTNSRTYASNCGESTVYFSERMTTMSLTAVDGSGGKAASRTSSARSDSGLFVGEPSVVRLPPRSVAIAATASTTTMIQAPIVRHAWRALAAARDLVESLMRSRPCLSRVRTSVPRPRGPGT